MHFCSFMQSLTQDPATFCTLTFSSYHEHCIPDMDLARVQVSLRLSGDMAQPRVEGAAQVSKAALVCPWTRYPVSNLSATVRLADNALKVPLPLWLML